MRTRHPAVLIAVLAAAGISVSLMQTLIIPLIPELPTLLNTSAANASWAITVTLLTAAVAHPVFGRLGDMYGPKPIMLVCAALLMLGSLLAAVSTTLLPLIVGRGLQGFGISIIPLGISVMRVAVPPEKVGTAMGLMSSSLGVGGAMGLPLSAIIAENADWHVLFWVSAGLGAAALVFFAWLVPGVPPTAGDRLDPLGTVLLAVGLIALLLGITKGADWGWTSGVTLGLFAGSVVVLVVFGWWQFRVESPTVDLRTTMRRPVLTTNLASIAVGFSLFAMSLIAPQIYEMPAESGYGLGQSLLHTGLWMAPGGLAMMLTSPLAARIAGVRGPRFTLIAGSVMVAIGYLAGLWLMDRPWQLSMFNVLVSVGVGFAFSSLPALINAAVPVSETAAANGLNALARSLGTSISSAVIGAVLAAMTTQVAGHDVPSLAGLRAALVIAAGAAILAALLAMAIPRPRAESADDDVALATGRSAP